FTRFHFYDLDICMQALEFGKVYVTADIRVLHKSEGSFEGEWKEWNQIFVEKWRDKLPAKTIDEPPPPNKLLKTGRIDLRGKIKVPSW
ncbi:MAG: hypothetical protein FWF67_01655, partial [Fibromonadales bacterium]|nr:hypothetical protein [Fibromonadales bacterium]